MDENICHFCKRNERCEERTDRKNAGEIVIDCENFEDLCGQS